MPLLLSRTAPRFPGLRDCHSGWPLLVLLACLLPRPGALGADTTPPRIVSVGSIGGQTIGICFDEPLDPASAGNPDHYTLEDGVVVTAATLRADRQSVSLEVSGLDASKFAIAVNGVADLSGNSTSASAEGEIIPLTAVDIGNPAEPGRAFGCAAGAIDLRAGGADIYGTADSFSFIHQQRAGDFDVRMQLARLDTVGAPGSHYTRGGLMARESLEPGSRNLLTGTYSPNAAFNKWVATARLLTEGATDLIPGNSFPDRAAGFLFPSAWLRLRRTANTFYAYYGTNGSNWIQLGNAFTPSPPYPETILLGLAASSVDNAPGQTTFAQFRNLTGFTIVDTNPPVLLAAANTGLTSIVLSFSESLDPSSATNLDHYAIEGGATLLAATLKTPQIVVLLTSPLTLDSHYTVIVSQLRDRASPPNTIVPGSAQRFIASDQTRFQPMDIGNSEPAGS